MTGFDDLFAKACAARDKAYAPYSKFKVGAVVVAGSGRIYAGCNVENAAYPQGWCAEASAIAAMVMAGEQRIMQALVVGGGAQPCTPCGGCRQKLREFAADDVEVHVCGLEGHRLTLTLGELMPHAFGPQNLRDLEPDQG